MLLHTGVKRGSVKSKMAGWHQLQLKNNIVFRFPLQLFARGKWVAVSVPIKGNFGCVLWQFPIWQCLILELGILIKKIFCFCDC
jgi:hypothetical protein